MKRFISIFFIFFVFTIILSSCEANKININSVVSSKSSVSAKVLPALEVEFDKTFTPKKGISLSKAQNLIITYLKKNKIKGDISSDLHLKEITVEEAWNNIGIQIYRVDVGYVCLYGVAIIKDGKVLYMLDGMPTNSVFLADLDKDSYYEVYTNVSIGSGIVSEEIRGFNISSLTHYSLSKRMKKDLKISIQDNVLWVKESPAMNNSNESFTMGRLAIKENNGKKELYINYDSESKFQNYIFPVSPKVLTIDLVGSNRKQIITDKQTIKNIVEILNSIELKPLSKEDEMGIMASSVGGLSIVPDNNNAHAVYVYGAGAIVPFQSIIYTSYVTKNGQNQNNTIYYISKETIRELYNLINAYMRNEVLTQTLKAVGKKLPATSKIGVPVICDLSNSYDWSQTLALIKREVKGGEPLLTLYVLDGSYNIIAEFKGQMPKLELMQSYTAYTVYFRGETITFGGLGKNYLSNIADTDITSVSIDYDKCSGITNSPMTKYGYIFAIGQKVIPKELKFYNKEGEVIANQNSHGVGLGMIYDDVNKKYIIIK